MDEKETKSVSGELLNLFRCEHVESYLHQTGPKYTHTTFTPLPPLIKSNLTTFKAL